MVPYRFASNAFVDTFFNKAIIASLYGSSFDFADPFGRPSSLSFIRAALNPSLVRLLIKSGSFSFNVKMKCKRESEGMKDQDDLRWPN